MINGLFIIREDRMSQQPHGRALMCCFCFVQLVVADDFSWRTSVRPLSV